METLRDWLVLDIDDVLARTTVFWIEELQRLFGNDEWLSAEAIRKKYFYAQAAPYPSWNSEDALKTIEDRQVNDDTQLWLQTILWAKDWVDALLADSVDISCYLTARPDIVTESTRTWLLQQWFPDRPIFLRPQYIEKHQTGQRKAEFLHTHKQLLGIVDDSPWLIKHLPSDYHGTVYLFQTKEYENPNNIKVVQCTDWDDVVEKIS